MKKNCKYNHCSDMLIPSLALLALMVGVVGWGFPDMYFLIRMTALALMIALLFILIASITIK